MSNSTAITPDDTCNDLTITPPTTAPSPSAIAKRLRSLSPQDDPSSIDDAALLSLSLDSILPISLQYCQSNDSVLTLTTSVCSNTLKSILSTTTISTSCSTAASSSDSSSPNSPTSTFTSPLSSPPLSRSISRRSSSSSKSVRFARCTNASVYLALSGDDYDRTSIVPTAEAESLELPRRKRSEAEGWIKCVERERKAAQLKNGKRKALPSSNGSTTSTATAVEGVNGLVAGAGGYFEEMSHSRDSSIDRSNCCPEGEGNDLEERTADVTDTDAEEEDNDHQMEEDDTPALIQDDSSGDDSDSVLSSSLIIDPVTTSLIASSTIMSTQDEEEIIDLLLLGGEDDIAIEPLHLISTPIKRPAPVPSPPLSSSTYLYRYDHLPSDSASITPTALSFTHYRSTPHPAKKIALALPTDDDTMDVESDSGNQRDREDNSANHSDEEDAEEEEEEEEDQSTKVDRYGLCALGKYSRAEVFQSYDSLGGF